MNKKKNNNLMGEIPKHFTFSGIFISILSILAIVFAVKTLFN
jgi:hypothetical protein